MKKQNRNQISLDFIVSEIKDSSHYLNIPTKNKRIMKSVIQEYLKDVKENMKNGFEVHVPRIGAFGVYENKLEDNQMPNESKAIAINQGEKKISKNPLRVGFWYSIEMKSHLAKKFGMEFKASEGLKKLISESLYSDASVNYQKNYAI